MTIAQDAECVQRLAASSAAELRRTLAELDMQSAHARQAGYSWPPAFYENRARVFAALQLRARRDRGSR